jgi:hypothetical protein
MNTPPVDTTPELGENARATAIIFWSGFLAAALAMVLCFAFIDPLALVHGKWPEGEAPPWWATRRAVYAVGFFFFWLIGMVAAALCWQLARPGRRGG